jgi:hypothetical protein
VSNKSDPRQSSLFREPAPRTAPQVVEKKGARDRSVTFLLPEDYGEETDWTPGPVPDELDAWFRAPERAWNRGLG